MAAPITHIVLSNSVYSKYFSNLDRKEFFIGTCFPDIRYLGCIDREKTHFTDFNMEDFKTKSIGDSFMSGVMFHSYVDRVRHNFSNSRGILKRLPESVYATQALKFLEDMFLYKYIGNWNEYCDYLSSTLDEEVSFGIDESIVVKWHSLISAYLSVFPSYASLNTYATGMGFSSDVTDEICNVVSLMEKDPIILEYIEDLYTHFDDLLK